MNEDTGHKGKDLIQGTSLLQVATRSFHPDKDEAPANPYYLSPGLRPHPSRLPYDPVSRVMVKSSCSANHRLFYIKPTTYTEIFCFIEGLGKSLTFLVDHILPHKKPPLIHTSTFHLNWREVVHYSDRVYRGKQVMK